MAFNPNPYPLLFLFVLLNSTSLVLLFAASAPSSFSSLRVSPSPRLQEYISRGRNLVQLVIPPCVGRRSRRKRLRSRGEYRREIITTALYAARRNFTRISLEILSFPGWLAPDPWNRYIRIHTYISSIVSRVVSILAIITGFIRFFSGCRDTQHHAADDKREGGLYVRAAERHRCDTVRRVRESDPHEQVRDRHQQDIRMYEFVALLRSPIGPRKLAYSPRNTAKLLQTDAGLLILQIFARDSLGSVIPDRLSDPVSRYSRSNLSFQGETVRLSACILLFHLS